MLKYGCPFCGEIAGLKSTSTYVQCRRCGAVGPYITASTEPVEMWNQRKALDDILIRMSRDELLAAQGAYRRVDGLVEGAKRTEFCIVVPCTALKTELPNLEVTLSAMKPLPQDDLQKEWLTRISDEPARVSARNMYSGRSVRILAPLAMSNDAEMYIVSTGVGLTPADQPIPAYDLTLHRDDDSSLYRKIIGPINPRKWWKGMQESPFNLPLSKIVQDEKGIIVLALTDDFVDMLYDDLLEISLMGPEVTNRLRIFTIGLLPEGLQKCILPYTETGTKNLLRSGSRLDFLYRIAYHYISNRLLHSEVDPQDLESCVAWVKAITPGDSPDSPTQMTPGVRRGPGRPPGSGRKLPQYAAEEREEGEMGIRNYPSGAGRPLVFGDDQILNMIKEKGLARVAVVTGLHSLREQGISCSNARYTRLVDIARRDFN